MKLIILLLAVALEHRLGALERLRDLRWVQSYADWLHDAFGGSRAWRGPLGVVLCVGLPVLVVAAVLEYLARLGLPLLIAGDVVVLLYCLGPQDLGRQVEAYLRALATGDAAGIEAAARALAGQDAELAPERRLESVLAGICVAANERLFAAYFWFGVLGPLGAVLFRLASELRKVSSGRSLEFTEAATRLHAILDWVPARLFALGFALAGSLLHTFDAWQFRRTLALEENEHLVRVAGLGALLFDRPGEALPPEEERNWVEEVRGLLVRTFCVWLSVFAGITITGWVA